MKKITDTYYLLDIIEIIYEKKLKIILIAFLLFLPLSGFQYYSDKQEPDIYNGSITIFPSDKTDLLIKFNRYNELLNDKTLSILGYENLELNKSTFAQDLLNRRSKNSYYVSPTTLIWEFNDLLQKELTNFDGISQIKILTKDHNFYESHLSSLMINFKIDNNNKSTTDELKKIINDTILLSKIRFGNLIDKLSEDLENIVGHENSMKLAKFDNIYEMINILEDKNYQDQNLKDIKFPVMENSNIIFNNSHRSMTNNIMNYCLNNSDKKLRFGETNLSNTKILLDKCKKFIKEEITEERKAIFFGFKNLLLDFKSDDFYTVSLSAKNKIKISKLEKNSKNYLYISLLLISLFISIFLTVILEMLFKKKNI